jgi:hypothetical protein
VKVVEVKKEQQDKRLQKEKQRQKEKGQKEKHQHGLYHSRHYDWPIEGTKEKAVQQSVCPLGKKVKEVQIDTYEELKADQLQATQKVNY